MNRIIFPLDGSIGASLQEMQHWGKILHGKIGLVKVGLRAFVANGPLAIKWASSMNVPIMLDLKLHDIPNTMKEATEAIVKLREEEYLDIRFLTVHASAGQKALESCLEVCDKTGLYITAVTILTSVKYEEDRFLKHVNAALKAGVRTFVCSPNEVGTITALNSNTTIITPGIRLAKDSKDDQIRTNTPLNAVHNGADYIVVGRSIRLADNPAKVADTINKQAEIGWFSRKKY